MVQYFIACIFQYIKGKISFFFFPYLLSFPPGLPGAQLGLTIEQAESGRFQVVTWISPPPVLPDDVTTTVLNSARGTTGLSRRAGPTTCAPLVIDLKHTRSTAPHLSLVRVEVELKTRKSRTRDKKERKPREISLRPCSSGPPSRAGEMAGISRAIRACAAASRRTLAAASGAALPKEEAAGSAVRAAATGRRGRDQEDGRRVQWVFLGCPGVGKGTYASRLSQLLSVPHIATGDLVRDALASPGPFSKKV